MKELKPGKSSYRLKKTFDEFKTRHFYRFQEKDRKQRIEILKSIENRLPGVATSIRETETKQLLTL